jgi:cell division protein FtsI/penicillin-binding protein 2
MRILIYEAVFCGYFPVENPQYAISVCQKTKCNDRIKAKKLSMAVNQIIKRIFFLMLKIE